METANPQVIEALRGTLGERGFNVTGTVSVGRFDEEAKPGHRLAEAMPQALSVLVVASGGRLLWERIAGDPKRLADPNPVDSYTEDLCRDALRKIREDGIGGRLLLPFGNDLRHGISFQRLGHVAGIGVMSRLGLLIHPEYGPWIALRAAFLLPVSLPEVKATREWSPCHGCSAPCETACPGRVVHPEGTDIPGCSETRLREEACATGCPARVACVVGPENRYSETQVRHHHGVLFRHLQLTRY